MFVFKRGIKQGDPLSSNLFNAVLEEVFRDLEWEEVGIRVNGKRLNNLKFADDIVLMGESRKEIEKMLSEPIKACGEPDLEINTENTK